MNVISSLCIDSYKIKLLIQGFINIIQVEGNLLDEIIFLVESILQNHKYDEKTKNKLRNLLEEDFDLILCKEILINDEKLKNFFFEISIMLVSISSLSEDEKEAIESYAKEFNFDLTKLNLIFKQTKKDLEKTSYDIIQKLFSKLVNGYVKFLNDGYSNDLNYLSSLRQLYCLTNGKINDLIVLITRYFNPPKKNNNLNGLLGEFSENDILEISQKIYENGYYIFENKLSGSFCDDLIKFTSDLPATPTILNDQTPPKVIFDKNNLISSRYQYDSQDIIEHGLIQSLIADNTFFAIAQEYFGCIPVFDFCTMWWSSDFLSKNYLDDENKAFFHMSQVAQLYHFDMDRTKFLKVFIYLTDVNDDNGPHVYVKSSNTHKPYDLLRDGRISDEEIEFYYKNDIIEMKGKKGTVFIEDTSGFHKGKHLISGERLVLQFEFSTDLFGQNYGMININEKFTESLKETIREKKYTFSNFT